MIDDEEVLCKYGTPLEQLVEDEIPSKKPIGIEDQIAVDSNGRRRFHGAFTGGFSAGFWNTVGSLEGWKPQQFKSTRAEKADRKVQKPEDFMDDEDVGEFGIAPQRVQAQEDFAKPGTANSATNKRKLQKPSDGPIPGVPVLKTLLEPARDTIAIRLLKQMGWREGQGVGARLTRKEKKKAQKRNKKEMYLIKNYGCTLGPIEKTVSEAVVSDDEDKSDSSDSSSDVEITFAPDDFETLVATMKENTFGLGYSGLERKPVLNQHVNLFAPFEMVDRNNKKLSITGHGFGVGAFEEDDDDIYAGEDMTRYDFSLMEAKKKKNKKNIIEEKKDLTLMEGFLRPTAAHGMRFVKKVYNVDMPANFKPRNWMQRKTRFEPLNEDLSREISEKKQYKLKGLGRHDLTPQTRGKILNEPVIDDKSVENNTVKIPEQPPVEIPKIIDKRQLLLEKINAKYEKFTVGEIFNADNDEKTEQSKESSSTEDKKIAPEEQILISTSSNDSNKDSGKFKPFIADCAKQERYEKFLEYTTTDMKELLELMKLVQPFHMSDWEREMELREFKQAKCIYKPLQGLMSDRFVSEVNLKVKVDKVKTPDAPKVITMKREKTMWKPCSDMCKRFNVPEPFGGTMEDDKKSKKGTRFSVFDYLENSVNKKSNFLTPVIKPSMSFHKNPVEESKNITNKIANEQVIIPTVLPEKVQVPAENIILPVTTTNNKTSAEQRISAKDFFTNNTSAIKKTVDDDLQLKNNNKIVKKTELELKIEESKDKHPAEKKDLFKLIFDNSDSETDDPNDKSSVNKDSIEKFFIKPTASDINILRNTSPPRGIFANMFASAPTVVTEEGDTLIKDKEVTTVPSDIDICLKVDQVLDVDKTTKTQHGVIKFRSKVERQIHNVQSEEQESVEDLYGPKLPVSIGNKEPKNSEEDNTAQEIDKKLEELLKRTKKNSVVEKWVEKEKMEKKKKRKDKDKDKSKSKNKKSKNKKDKKKHKERK